MNPSRIPLPQAFRESFRSGTSRAIRLSLVLAVSSLIALPLATCADAAQAKPEKTAKTSRATKTPTRAEVTEKRGDLKELRGQIEELRKDAATTEGKRSDTQAQLKAVEQDIAATESELQTLATQRSRLQETLRDLAQQSRDLETRIAHQQNQLEQLIYRQYLQGNPDSLRLLLNGDNPSQTVRDLYYLAAVGRSRSELLSEIEASLQHKQALASDTRERAADLAAIEDKQKAEHEKLLGHREQRAALLARLSSKLADQQREIGSLERDEKQLSQLIDRLAKMIAARPKPKPLPKIPRETAANSSRSGNEAKPANARTAPAETRSDSSEAESGTPTTQIKGNLRLPVRGALTNRFGGARQEGSTWKGLFIRAAQGSEVRAVAGGRVVFSDWMRGFGNLLIIDHGGSYLSVYGNNDNLLKQNGDAVNSGDVIASVGNSGGNPESGLYFELRYQGKPIDPLKWVGAK